MAGQDLLPGDGLDLVQEEKAREGNGEPLLTPTRPAHNPNAGTLDKPLPGPDNSEATPATIPGPDPLSPRSRRLVTAPPQVTLVEGVPILGIPRIVQHLHHSIVFFCAPHPLEHANNAEQTESGVILP